MSPDTSTLDRPVPPIDPRIKARRIEVRRTEGRRRLQRLADAGAVLVVVAAFGLALRSPLLDVDRVEVSGTGRTTAEQIRESLGIPEGEPLMDVDLGAAGERVAALPWIDEVQLHRGIDGTISVSVTERTAVARVAAGDGAVLVDREGRVLGPADGGADSLVLVSGIDRVPVAGRYLTPEIRGVLLAAGSLAVSAPGAVSELRAGSELRAALTAGGEVRLGDASQLDAKVSSLVTMLQQVDLTCLVELDVRLPGSPVLTRDDACS